MRELGNFFSILCIQNIKIKISSGKFKMVKKMLVKKQFQEKNLSLKDF